MLRRFVASKKHLLLFFIAGCIFLEAATLFLYSSYIPHSLVLFGVTLVLAALILGNGLIFSLQDKTAQAEEKLRKSEELFAMVIRGINDGIFDLNLVTNEIQYAASYEAILGYTLEEMQSNHEHFEKLMHPDDLPRVQEIGWQYFRREIPLYNVTFRLRHKQGHWVWVVSRGVGIWDAAGNIQRLIGTHTDISRQKAHEEEVQQLMQENERQRQELELARDRAEAANRAKSDFLATMSHEIRTPMNAVIGLSSIMVETQLLPRQREMMHTLQVNAEILMQLVNDLLDLNRIEAAETRLEQLPFTVADMLQTLHVMFQPQMAAKKLNFTVTNQCGDAAFIGDRTRIQQILVNLVSNAYKFTAAGDVSLNASHTTQADGRAIIRLTVRDTGVGIPASKLDHIFDKFVQADQTISRRFGGSGLGLAICKSLTHLMAGNITVSSEQNAGSSFVVDLPLPFATPQSPQTAPAISPAPQSPAAGVALIVEDYPANVLVATLMLEQLNYKVEVARSGAEALEKFAARNRPYSVILMDVQMPDIDGYETTRRIRALEKEKGFANTIIGVTANAFAGDRALCLQAGMDDYISKPILQDLLEKKLAALPAVAA